jgi:hypothetical protein
MEHVEGEPLKGPLPLPLALKYGGQICEALEAAHNKGITHRDLKPGNILVTKLGVKLLDFGLARMESPDATATMAAVGTPAYMAPEQWEGKPGDARSDIYSLGCVLYEMFTGKRMPLQERLAVEPVAVESVVERCLRKEPDERWQSARDVRHALEMLASTAGTKETKPFPRIVTATVSTLLAVAALVIWWRQQAPKEHPIQFQVNPPRGAVFPSGVGGGGSAISPDGRGLAFVAASSGIPKLWVRALDSINARELAGTEGADFPFWSPDGRSLGFFASGKLKRIDLAGGPPVVLADAVARGGAWGTDGTILFTPNYGGCWSSRWIRAGGCLAVWFLSTAARWANRWDPFPASAPARPGRRTETGCICQWIQGAGSTFGANAFQLANRNRSLPSPQRKRESPWLLTVAPWSAQLAVNRALCGFTTRVETGSLRRKAMLTPHPSRRTAARFITWCAPALRRRCRIALPEIREGLFPDGLTANE